MRLLSTLLSASLLVAGTLAAKKSSSERFTEYHKKAQSSTPLKLTEVSYKSLTTAPRDYSVAVLLTALDARFGCQLCQDFQPEWEVVSRSWIKGDKDGESRLLFGTLDFADGRDVFLSLGLQTAPVLMLFQPTQGPHAVADPEPIRYDFTTGPTSAEQVQHWLARSLPDRPHPEVKRPINWVFWGSAITFVLGAGTVISQIWSYLLPVIQSRQVWASFSLVAILLFISGHMFNHIRKVPYVAGDGKGGMQYFAANFQNQFGLETQIVAAMYGLLSFSTIALAIRVPRMSVPKSQTVAVFAWAGATFVLYSFLLSVFRIKNGGYPFSLPPFM